MISGNDTVIGEIVGLPGERLQIANEVFIIDGQLLDVEKYPVPQSIQFILRNLFAIKATTS